MKMFIQKYSLQIIGFFIVLILFLLVLLFKSVFFATNNPNDEISNLVERVGEHMFLPEGESPTLATVSDPKLLQGQEFFLNAKAGDKVLMYVNAKKAILYDPIADKIITIAPLSSENKNTNPSLQNTEANILQDQF